MELIFKNFNENLNALAKYLNIQTLKNLVKHNNNLVLSNSKNLNYFIKNYFKQKKAEVFNYLSRLENLSIEKVLKRGFAIIKDSKEKKIMNLKKIKADQLIDVEFHNGVVTAKTMKKYE